VKYSYHEDGTQPTKEQIFVFGSNLAGVHGAGAAKQAIEYGAQWGRGTKWSGGRTYAIPSKDRNIKTMSLTEIDKYIKIFLYDTELNPQLTFFITRIGCELAGYKDSDIAPLFKGASNNCNFPKEWKEYLEDE
jgi:hypothetical protein